MLRGGALSGSPTSSDIQSMSFYSDIQSIVQAGTKASYSSTSTGATHLRSDGTRATLPSGSYQRLLAWLLGLRVYLG